MKHKSAIGLAISPTPLAIEPATETVPRILSLSLSFVVGGISLNFVPHERQKS